ncbi:hypothetical protein OPV22_000413 [Ensete ventricosum]|uniref:Uncharacterized protein n=1 Tax=Ensete ventricosum TaxID=4639 RepID=A0AAV8RVH4_ENSVE|nr:hypothetical protein OPV22_000413 [Ensete ventricosum]
MVKTGTLRRIAQSAGTSVRVDVLSRLGTHEFRHQVTVERVSADSTQNQERHETSAAFVRVVVRMDCKVRISHTTCTCWLSTHLHIIIELKSSAACWIVKEHSDYYSLVPHDAEPAAVGILFRDSISRWAELATTNVYGHRFHPITPLGRHITRHKQVANPKPPTPTSPPCGALAFFFCFSTSLYILCVTRRMRLLKQSQTAGASSTALVLTVRGSTSRSIPSLWLRLPRRYPPSLPPTSADQVEHFRQLCCHSWPSPPLDLLSGFSGEMAISNASGEWSTLFRRRLYFAGGSSATASPPLLLLLGVRDMLSFAFHCTPSLNDAAPACNHVKNSSRFPYHHMPHANLEISISSSLMVLLWLPTYK